MTVKLSTGLCNKMLAGGVNGGFKLALDGGFINIYSGNQPSSADAVAPGTLLGTVTLNGDGTTGLDFDDPANGAIAKDPAQNWRFLGLTEGTAGWFRFYAPSTNPAAASTTDARIDGAIGTGMSDLNLSNVSVVTGAPSTIDVFRFTLPRQ